MALWMPSLPHLTSDTLPQSILLCGCPPHHTWTLAPGSGPVASFHWHKYLLSFTSPNGFKTEMFRKKSNGREMKGRGRREEELSPLSMHCIWIYVYISIVFFLLIFLNKWDHITPVNMTCLLSLNNDILGITQCRHM